MFDVRIIGKQCMTVLTPCGQPIACSSNSQRVMHAAAARRTGTRSVELVQFAGKIGRRVNS
jgi:hypothetical protein